MDIQMNKYLAITKVEEDKREDRRKVTITVKDWNGRLVPGAEVRLYKIITDKEFRFLAKGYTGREGNLVFNGLKKDSDYDVRVAYKGVKSEVIVEAIKSIDVEKDADKEVDNKIGKAQNNRYEDYDDYDYAEDEGEE